MTKASPASRIHLCRAYDVRAGAKTFGARLLIDRLWPRGIAKADLPIDAWLKDVAPSSKLRKWFNHDPAKWDEFRTRYVAELDAISQAVDEALDWCHTGPVTLIYAAKDTEHANAPVLRDYLAARLLNEIST